MPKDVAGIAAAGLCIRKLIAEAYCRRVESDPLLKKLAGSDAQIALADCGDLDMAFTACGEGFAVGMFPQLQMYGHISKNRVQVDYLLSAVEAYAYATTLNAARREKPRAGKRLPAYRRQLGQLKRRWTMTRRERLFFEARLRGQQNALKDIKNQGLMNRNVSDPSQP